MCGNSVNFDNKKSENRKILTFLEIKDFLRKKTKSDTFIIPSGYDEIEEYAFSQDKHPEVVQLKKVVFNSEIKVVPR